MRRVGVEGAEPASYGRLSDVGSLAVALARRSDGLACTRGRCTKDGVALRECEAERSGDAASGDGDTSRESDDDDDDDDELRSASVAAASASATSLLAAERREPNLAAALINETLVGLAARWPSCFGGMAIVSVAGVGAGIAAGGCVGVRGSGLRVPPGVAVRVEGDGDG